MRQILLLWSGLLLIQITRKEGAKRIMEDRIKISNMLELSKSIMEGDTARAVALTRSALKEGIAASDILEKGLVPGIGKTGELFDSGEFFLPELLVSGEAMEAALEELRPELTRCDTPFTGKYLIGTVQGDVHDIGKNIVIMMLNGNGWDVTDLGVDVPPEKFCEAVREADFDVLGMSALLTLTMSKQSETIGALEAAGLRDMVKIMIGGAAVTQCFADEIGADAYAANAYEAVVKAATLLKKRGR